LFKKCLDHHLLKEIVVVYHHDLILLIAKSSGNVAEKIPYCEFRIWSDLWLTPYSDNN